MGWAVNEFEKIDLGDKRLNVRIVRLCDTLSEAPESPINQACADWAETKAAYRFFQNDNVDTEQIMSAHRRRQRNEPLNTIRSSSFRIPATSSTPAIRKPRDWGISL